MKCAVLWNYVKLSVFQMLLSRFFLISEFLRDKNAGFNKLLNRQQTNRYAYFCRRYSHKDWFINLITEISTLSWPIWSHLTLCKTNIFSSEIFHLYYSSTTYWPEVMFLLQLPYHLIHKTIYCSFASSDFRRLKRNYFVTANFFLLVAIDPRDLLWCQENGSLIHLIEHSICYPTRTVLNFF